MKPKKIIIWVVVVLIILSFILPMLSTLIDPSVANPM